MSSGAVGGLPGMTFTHVLAQATVSDLAAAEPWYTALLGRAPDLRPMAGLLEWHLVEGSGLQVWHDPARSGRSTLVLGVSDLDATAARVAAAGVDHDGPRPVGGGRVLQVSDADGNRVVLIGA